MNQRPDIPVPSENILPVQVSQLAGLTQSAAIESLISQNIDLTTRLNINLRRVADMERMLQGISAQQQGFETQKEAFREELQVLHKRYQAQESKLLTHRLEKEGAEKAYANLVIDHKSIKEKFEADKIASQKVQQRIYKFRYKIHNYIRPLLKSLQADSDMLPELQDDVRRFKRYRSRIQKIVRPLVRNLKFQIKTYRDRCERLEVKTTELSRKIEDLLNHLRTRAEQFESDQKKLVGYHEDRWSETNQKLERTQADLESALAREKTVINQKTQMATEKDVVEEKNIELHNRAIASERRLEEIEKRYQADIENLQGSLAKYESMWNDSTKNLELTTIQLEASQRLNDSLSEDIRTERQQIEDLKTRIRHMKIQEVALQSARNAEPLLQASAGIPQQIIEEPNLPIQKLESLFAEIESGDFGQDHNTLGEDRIEG